MTYKADWSTGDILTAAQQNSLAEQAVSRFADASARNAAITSPTEGQTCWLNDTNEFQIYDGSSWKPLLDTDTFYVSSGNYTITGTTTFGSAGSGVDVSFHSATSGDLMLWDASDEKLVITGTDGQNALEVTDGDVSITDALTVTGTTTTYLNLITDSSTTRTPGLTDAGAYILTTHGTGITVTLPQDSDVAFPVGTTIYFERNGAGTLTFAAGAGATVNSKDGTLTCGDRYTTVASVKIAADIWTLIGNIG